MTRKKKRTQPIANAPEAQSAALERMRPLLSAQDFSALMEELKRPLYPAFRLNPLKVNPETVSNWAARYQWQLEPVPFCPEGYWVTQSPEPISQTLEHRLGKYYIQDAASMLPVELFDFDTEEHPLILDLAASPGGKTTHLVAKSKDHGFVIANDPGADRITALRIVLQTWGAVNAAVTRFPGEKFGGWYPETFDKVLLDAPCSMQGLLTTDSHPMRPITARERSGLAQRQTNLLASAVQAVRVGGQVVYSTCTLEPEEDEGVLDEILRRFPGAVQIEDLSRRLPSPAPALTAAGDTSFDPQVGNAARLWPHRFHTSGFFAARLTKVAPIDTRLHTPPYRDLHDVGQTPLSPLETNELAGLLMEHYGIDLQFLLHDLRLVLWRWQNSVFMVPETYLSRFNGLPCQLLGLKMIEETSEGWELSHEWVTRFGGQISRGTVNIPDEFVPLWLRGEDLLYKVDSLQTPVDLVILTDFSGRILGRARILPDRLKNLLPRRLI